MVTRKQRIENMRAYLQAHGQHEPWRDHTPYTTSVFDQLMSQRHSECWRDKLPVKHFAVEPLQTRDELDLRHAVDTIAQPNSSVPLDEFYGDEGLRAEHQELQRSFLDKRARWRQYMLLIPPTRNELHPKDSGQLLTALFACLLRCFCALRCETLTLQRSVDACATQRPQISLQACAAAFSCAQTTTARTTATTNEQVSDADKRRLLLRRRGLGTLSVR